VPGFNWNLVLRGDVVKSDTRYALRTRGACAPRAALDARALIVNTDAALPLILAGKNLLLEEEQH
jgi:hypothetical protein